MWRSLVTLIFTATCLILSPALMADVEQGYAWLASRQEVTGEFSANSSIARDLQATRASIDAFQAASKPFNQPMAWLYLTNQPRSDIESTASKLLAALNSGAGIQEQISALNAYAGSDGGYGSYPGFDSTPLDTAIALDVLMSANQASASQAKNALLWLAGKQSAGS